MIMKNYYKIEIKNLNLLKDINYKLLINYFIFLTIILSCLL